jgi:hypothetical protein
MRYDLHPGRRGLFGSFPKEALQINVTSLPYPN